MDDRTADRAPSATERVPKCGCGKPCLPCSIAAEVRANDVCGGDVFLRGYLMGLDRQELRHFCADHRKRFDVSLRGLDADDAADDVVLTSRVHH